MAWIMDSGHQGDPPTVWGKFSCEGERDERYRSGTVLALASTEAGGSVGSSVARASRTGRSDDHYIISNDINHLRPRAELRHNVTGVGEYHTGHRSCSACNARQKNES